MRLQILVVSLLASTTHGFLFNPVMMALLRYRMGNMGRSPFMFNRGGVLETIRRNQLANMRSIMTRRRNLIRNRMGIGGGTSQRRFPQSAGTASINPERLEPFGGKLGGTQPLLLTIDNSPNIMSGITQQAPNVAMGQAQNFQATNLMTPQQQLGANFGPAVIEVGQQLPNVAMGQGTNIMVPQQQLGATFTANVGPSVIDVTQQVPNLAVGQIGGGLRGIQSPISQNVMSGIGAGVLLNSANMNNINGGPLGQPSASIGGAMSGTNQILPTLNAVPQQQVAMSNVFNTQQQQIAQNGVIGPVQATNGMAFPQQQIGASGIAQVPNVAMVQGTNVNLPQQQLGATILANSQLPNIGMGQAQTSQAMNRMGAQQQFGNMLSTNVGTPVIEVGQQLPNIAIGQAQMLPTVNIMGTQQQLGASVTANVAPSVVGQQVPNIAMSQATNIMVPQQQLGGTIATNPSIIDVAQQQLSNVAMDQAQRLQEINMMGPQQQLGASITANVGSPIIEIAQQQLNVATDPTQGSNVLTTATAVGDQLQQQALLNQLGTLPQMQVADPQLMNLDNAIASTQQQLSAIQNGIAEAKLQEQIIEANNKAAQQAQLRSGEMGSMAINPNEQQLINADLQQQLINSGNTIDLQQQPMMSAEQLQQQQQMFEMNNAIQNEATNVQQQQQQLFEMNNAIQNQAANVQRPQQLFEMNNAIQNQAANIQRPQQQQQQLQQQQMFEMNNAIQNEATNVQQQQQQQQQLFEMNNAIQNEATNVQQQLQQQQLFEMNNAIQNEAVNVQQQQQQQQLFEMNNAIQNQAANIQRPQQLFEMNNAIQNQAANIQRPQQQQQMFEMNNAIQNEATNLQQQQQQLFEMNNAIQNQAANVQRPQQQQQQQQQLFNMNNAIQNQATNVLLQQQQQQAQQQQQQQPNMADRLVQQLFKLSNRNSQQQTMSNIAPMQQDILNSAGQPTQLMSNMIQNPVPEILPQSVQQQMVNMNNAGGQQNQMGSSEIGSNMAIGPSQQIAGDIGMQQQMGSNFVTDPLSVNLNQQQGLNVMSSVAQQPQNLAGASNMLMTEQMGQVTEPFQQQQTFVDMTNTQNLGQQIGSVVTGSNIIMDPLQQQPIDLNIVAGPQPQTIGTVMEPSQQAVGGTNLGSGNIEQQVSGITNAASSTQQTTGTSLGQQTSYGPNPINFQQQVLDPNAPFDPLWSLGSAEGGIPYIDPMQVMPLVQNPYAQELYYSNQAMLPTYGNGVPLPNAQTSVSQGQAQTPPGQSGVLSSSQQGEFVPAQGSFAAQQQELNPPQQQIGAFSGTQNQLGPFDQMQPQNNQQTPWLSNLLPEPKQYMVNDPAMSGLQQGLQSNSQISNAAVPNQQQTNSVIGDQYQPPQTLQLAQTVQQPQATGTQITSLAQDPNTAARNVNTASSSQLSMASLGTPATSPTASGYSATNQQNTPLLDQSVQYRQAILDSILSSLQPQVVYNPISRLDGASAAQVVQKESALPSAMISPMAAEVGPQPTSPQPAFTVSDVIRSLASGGQVSGLPDQATVLADKKTANVQQGFISNQVDVTTASPLPVAPFSQNQYATQTQFQNSQLYGTLPMGSMLQPVSTQSYIPGNDFWSEMAIANALFNHPKQPLSPKQEQQQSKNEKQLNSLLQSMVLASLLPANNDVKQVPSAVVTGGDQKLSLSASKPLTTLSQTDTQNTPSLSAPVKSATLSKNVAFSSQQTASLGITLAPVIRQSPSVHTKSSVVSQSEVRKNQPESSFTSPTPLKNFSTGRYRSTLAMPM